MEKELVLMKEMNSLLSSTEPGEDFRNAQMKNFGREFLKVIILKHNQLHIGLMLKIERTITCLQL